ncbi:hypothetical protein [Bifidobacterium platyrrhinorum]|uniref:hypothetical protein n=1 Tax=Bifidobacterium platyrrhinorum TaxID=2661628 RepID=UPI0013D0055F|nr:hypothetical protein [Bifidobacterium platyrrhinorum]
MARGSRKTNIARMRAALYETLPFYDKADMPGEDYVLSPGDLAKFAADVCRQYDALCEE